VFADEPSKNRFLLSSNALKNLQRVGEAWYTLGEISSAASGSSIRGGNVMLRIAFWAIGMVATVMGAAVGDDGPRAPAPREKPDRQLTDVPPLPMLGQNGFQLNRNQLLATGLRSLEGFDFKIDPDTPIKELLPIHPRIKASSGPLMNVDDLRIVPEVEFQGKPRENDLSPAAATALQVAKARFLDRKQQDGFLLALRQDRRDIAGLPFQMGASCRSSKERTSDIADAARSVRTLLSTDPKASDPWPMMMFYLHGRHLTRLPHADATRALAKMVLFSTEPTAREEALIALGVRRERDYTDILLAGLNYPYPVVAQRAAHAIAQLQRRDLEPSLVALLSAPDPRLPQKREFAGKTGPVVREVVRVNHLTSCLMCHPPAGTGEARRQTAPIPVRGEKLPSPTAYYSSVGPALAIRFDMTYLRPDFSALLPVADADPWPQMQRFDFVVRERMLDEKEAAEFTTALSKNKPDKSPYRLAAMAALKELTGQERTAAEWRIRAEAPRK